MSAVAERLRSVRRQVADAADIAGRDPARVTIVAVAKTVGVVEVRNAVVAGCRDFGENRVQEFLAKRALFPDERWHFIGSLQTNKVKDVAGRATLIHSIDSLRLLEHVDRHAAEAGAVQQVLLQVNVSGEPTKHGLAPDEVEDVLLASGDLDNVLVKGLMTMAPLGRPEEARWVFRRLADLFAGFRDMRFNGVDLTELSMGMTNDFRVAVEEGATIVRIGRAIFGR
ncbi:MAG: YggS family pyridoxal phosphate-dependent enzyme [Coriobacteriia bacterium]